MRLSSEISRQTGPEFLLPPKTTGVGDVDDFGSSSAVDALEEDIQKVYNFT
jgi:hypothetical protein